MFTQCAKCETVFRLSADALRAAGGQVRCGRCGEVFNALARLAEEANAFTRGESPLDLETRAAEILESAAEHAAARAAPATPPLPTPTPTTMNDTAPPGVEIARLEILDPLDVDLTDESSLEFTLPPGELDRIFIETKPIALSLPLAPPLAPPSAPPRGPAASPMPLTRIAGLEVAEDVRQEMLSSYAHAELPEINPPPTRLPVAAWAAAAVVLGLLLLLQIIRGNAEWLAAHAPVLGTSTGPGVVLAAYQLRQWGVTGDPNASGTLRVRASIMNTAAQLEPYPLLRVTLTNRFGTRIGAREFEPAEYLGHGTARLMASGEHVDATLDIADPGQDAEGFEIDVCVRTTPKKIVCAADLSVRAK